MEYPIVHYPSSIEKYVGNVRYREKGKKRYNAHIVTKEHKIYKTFLTEKEAVDFVKETNKELGLQIQNRIREYPDYMETEIKEDTWIKFDKEDLQTVEDNKVFFGGNYACCWLKNKSVHFHTFTI